MSTENMTPDEIRLLAEDIYEDGDEQTARHLVDLADEIEHDAAHDTPDMSPTGEGPEVEEDWGDVGMHLVEGDSELL